MNSKYQKLELARGFLLLLIWKILTLKDWMRLNSDKWPQYTLMRLDLQLAINKSLSSHLSLFFVIQIMIVFLKLFNCKKCAVA